MNRTTPLVALAGLVALSGCAGLGFGDRYGDYRDGGYYETDRYDDRYGYDSGAYRAVQRDARDYADALDRYLRISNREERAVREILEYRTYELLEATRVRDHARVYPFPRRPGRAERFWALADRDIARVLDRRYREPYAYYNRYGADRYREYYRHRRYDDRRGWYDTRRDDGPRYDATRDSRRTPRRAEDRRDRREDAREDRRGRREEARRDDRRERDRAQRDRRRDQERRAAEVRERRREQAARQRAERERVQREERVRERSRRQDARRDDRPRRSEAKDDDRKEETRRSPRRSRRGGND